MLIFPHEQCLIILVLTGARSGFSLNEEIENQQQAVRLQLEM